MACKRERKGKERKKNMSKKCSLSCVTVHANQLCQNFQIHKKVCSGGSETTIGALVPGWVTVWHVVLPCLSLWYEPSWGVDYAMCKMCRMCRLMCRMCRKYSSYLHCFYPRRDCRRILKFCIAF